MNCSGYELPTIEIPINIELDNDEIDNQESSLKRSHAEVIQSPTFAEITATLQKKPHILSPMSSWIMKDSVTCSAGNLIDQLSRSFGERTDNALNMHSSESFHELLTKTEEIRSSDFFYQEDQRKIKQYISSPGIHNFESNQTNDDDSIKNVLNGESCCDIKNVLNDESCCDILPSSIVIKKEDDIPNYQRKSLDSGSCQEISIHTGESFSSQQNIDLYEGSKPPYLDHAKASSKTNESIPYESDYLSSTIGDQFQNKKPKKWSRWSKEEDEILRKAVQIEGEYWRNISRHHFKGRRNHVQCKNRWRKALQPGLCKNKWTADEDQIIIHCINEGITKWSEIATYLPGRLGEQIKERWINVVNPEFKKSAWTDDEIETLEKAQQKYGNRWSQIAKLLPGRSENSVKNRWYNSKTSARRASQKFQSNNETSNDREHETVDRRT